MKNFKNVLFAVVLVAAVMFSGCKKETENSDLVLDDYKTGTVTCLVRGAFAYGEDPEEVPDGTKVVFEASYASFNPRAKGNLTQVFEVSDGKIQAELKVPSKGVRYTIRVIGFEETYKKSDDTKATYLFEGNGSVSVKPYDNKVVKIVCKHGSDEL